MKIFVNSTQAAALMGLSRRQWERLYVETGKITPLVFRASGFAVRTKVNLFLVVDVKKLTR
jgi:hypothetical protein